MGFRWTVIKACKLGRSGVVMKTMGVGLGRLFVFAYKQSVRKKNDKKKVKEPAVRKLFGRVS